VSDRVAEEVEPLEAGVDAEFDPADDPKVVALDDRCAQVRVHAVVVGDRDPIEAGLAGDVDERRRPSSPPSETVVRVEVGDDPVCIHARRSMTPH